MTEDGATLKTEPITKVKKVCNKEKQAWNMMENGIKEN
jgi:hypothetical protein